MNVQDKKLPQRRNPAQGVHINLGQSNIVLLTVTTERRKPWLANETAQELLAPDLAGSHSLACRRLSAHARPYSLFLRSVGFAFYYREMDSVLEAGVCAQTKAAREYARPTAVDVPITRLAPPLARWRELFRKVALRAGESSAQKPLQKN